MTASAYTRTIRRQFPGVLLPGCGGETAGNRLCLGFPECDFRMSLAELFRRPKTATEPPFELLVGPVPT